MACEGTPLPEPAFCIPSGGSSTARRDPAAAHGFAEAALSQVAAPFLPPASSDLLLLGLLALAPAASASSQCSSFVQWVFVQCCSWKCLWQLWMWEEVHPSCIPRCSAHLEAPQSLGSALSLQLILPTSSPTRSRGAWGSREQSKPRSLPRGSRSTAATRFAV